MFGWRWFIAIVLLLAVAAAPPLTARPAVEAFVQRSIDRGISILTDKTLDAPARHAQVSELLAEVLDTRKMALSMLGKARDTANPSELDAYVEAYKAFALATYEPQLYGYGGQSLTVTGSVERAPGDYIVNLALIDPAAPSDPGMLPISVRVADEGAGTFEMTDAGVAGIWLGLAQRAEFEAFLSQHANSMRALTGYLRQMTAQLSVREPSP